MDRFYHYFDQFPSFSAFRAFLYGSSLNSTVSRSIPLIIAGIICTFIVSFFLSIAIVGGKGMGVKEIKVEIQKLVSLL